MRSPRCCCPPALCLVLLVPLFLSACRDERALPAPGSEAYREAVTAFYTGLAAIQAGEDLGADERLARVTELAPGEPAAWANLGLLALRRNAFEEAAARLQRAAELAPENSQIQMLLGRLAAAQGRFDEALTHLRRAAELDPQHLEARYALAQTLERQGAAGYEAEVQTLLEAIRTAQPDNLAVLLELARIAALRGDTQLLATTVDRIAAQAAGDWPAEVHRQLDALRQHLDAPRQAASQVAFLRNVLLQVPAFREDLRAIQTPAEQVGALLTHFIRLPRPVAAPAPLDSTLLFSTAGLSVPGGPWQWAGTLFRSGENAPAIVVAHDRALQFVDGPPLAFPGAPGPHGVAAFDYDYDFNMDFAAAGAGGLRLYRQDDAGGFTDVTAALPPGVAAAPYTGAWAADLDLEGDVDLLLGRPAAAPLLLRNNGDGTFTPAPLFPDVRDLRGFAWADLDADGDPDAALLDAAGGLHVRANQRAGHFRPLEVPARAAAARALATADLNGDGVLDLLLLLRDGTLLRLSRALPGPGWEAAEVARWDDLPTLLGVDGDTRLTLDHQARLFIADLDNNGGFDVVVSTPLRTRTWLMDRDGTLQPRPADVQAYVYEVAELTGDGRQDLLGLSGEGQLVFLVNRGTADYRWKTLRPRAAQGGGDQRINSFGIGGEIELRAGLLFQKQAVTSPIVHFGLGTHDQADLARIIWPNGSVQAEFDLEAGESLTANQRLKGSCPWVFTYDGTGMRFVTDFIWRSPLGLRINAQETAGIMATEDWVKIRGDQLVPRDGVYDVRITAELWETHFFDHVSLMVVDHPEEVDVFIDERFAFPPPAFRVHPMTPPRPVAQAWDQDGRDVTEIIRAKDDRYLGGFPAGDYQGIAAPHYVEVDLGAGVPAEGPLYLLAFGWVRPTDSSINVAISQGTQAAPQGLRLEVPDGRGGWRVVHPNLGFPSGKQKTILVDLQDAFLPGTPRRVRLATNLEVYWDEITWAVARPEAELHLRRLAPETADLRFRGYSVVTEADRTAPELPHYDRLMTTTQIWRDLVGYYTRFGDVRELLQSVDDRYVIMNAGDEMAFRFPAPPPPPAGWTRDFVLIGDGWVKDGDYNTTFSKTVLPLPAHDRPTYDTPPTTLYEDPVYQRHPDDWRRFHTRYVTPEAFHSALHLE